MTDQELVEKFEEDKRAGRFDKQHAVNAAALKRYEEEGLTPNQIHAATKKRINARIIQELRGRKK